MASETLEEGVLLNDRFRIVRVLGRGGMGTVYMAEHVQLETVVAVKEVMGPRSNEEEYALALQQCAQEAKFLVRLNHPNLPRVMDAFIQGDRFYLVMEYIEGMTLETRLREQGGGPLAVMEMVEWGLQIADVLAYLHSQQPPIIFRDLKPGNIMIQPDGSLRLIDFGIARRFQPGASKDTALLGSVGYSPPEQFGKHQTDTRSDIYAFGATLHHLLTGRDPAAEPFKFPPARSLNPQIPEPLSRLLEECLAMDAGARPAGIHEVALRLLAVRDELAAHPPLPSALVPVGLDGPAAAPATLPVTGTGPRIISAKLAEAEAQRRRESREMRPPSGPTAGSGTVETRRRSPASALAIILLLSVVGVTVSLYPTFQRSRKTPANAVPPPAAPSVGRREEPQSALTNSTPPTKMITEPAPPPAVNRVAEITQASVEGIALDEQGSRYLSLNVSGKVHQQSGRAGMVAVFFFDAQDRALPAMDPKGRYANRDGQLSVSYSLDIRANDFPYSLTLTVPMEQFPPDSLAAGIKYRCVTFVEDKRVAQTELLAVPYNLSVPPSGGNASPSGSAQTPPDPRNTGSVPITGGNI